MNRTTRDNQSTGVGPVRNHEQKQQEINKEA
jgi:hypothetical protein